MRCSVLFLVLGLAAACGGNVERDGGSGGASAAASGGTPGTGFPSSPLGECKPGFAQHESPTLPCPWLADGLCYAEKAAACACACPKDHDSWCQSDFPDPSGAPVLVFCD